MVTEPDHEWTTSQAYLEGYADGIAAARASILQYATDTHRPHSRFTGCPRCDITAALTVAASTLRETP